MAPVGILAVLLTPLVGKLLGRIDPRLIATTAFLIFSVVFYLRSKFTPEVDSFTLIVPTVIQGAAMAMFFIPLTAIILSGQHPSKIPAAAGLSNFVRIMFGGMGTSLITTLWDRRTTLHHAQLAEHATATNPAYAEALRGLASQGIPEPAALAVLERNLSIQASTLGATDLFHLFAIVFLLLISLIWLTKRAKRSAGAEASGAH
jgi:DHA2 family multidrug resistance protein